MGQLSGEPPSRRGTASPNPALGFMRNLRLLRSTGLRKVREAGKA
jgi:hypothetical protein